MSRTNVMKYYIATPYKLSLTLFLSLIKEIITFKLRHNEKISLTLFLSLIKKIMIFMLRHPKSIILNTILTLVREIIIFMKRHKKNILKTNLNLNYYLKLWYFFRVRSDHQGFDTGAITPLLNLKKKKPIFNLINLNI